MSFKKRVFDILIVICAAPAWVPAIIITSIAIFVTSGPPIFYFSKRYVQQNKFKTVFKFRTMIHNAEKIANRDTVTAESNKILNIVIQPNLYTRLGVILEKFHFTELPQLAQVLSGTLTLVGNRPMPQNMLDLAKKSYPYIEERFAIPAGITGPAQLAGREGLTDQERLTLEITYTYICQAAYNPLLDFHLLAITAFSPLGLLKAQSYKTVLELMYDHISDPRKKIAISQRVDDVIRNKSYPE